MRETADARRALPSVDAVLREAGELDDRVRERLTAAIRDVLAEHRAAGQGLDATAAARLARERIAGRDRPKIGRAHV